MFTRTQTAIVLAAAALAGPAIAQDTGSAGGSGPLSNADIVAFDQWTYDDIYANGVSVQNFFDMDVYGADGEDIGDVEDVLIGPDGRVLAIVAEVGGFWDIGDTHVSIPFDMVEARADGEGINVPIREDNVDDFGLDRDLIAEGVVSEEVVAGVDDAAIQRAWRAWELIGDRARLTSDDGYEHFGYVNDLILSDGEVSAVVVEPGAGYGRGYRAYPYGGYGTTGWAPGAPYYDLPEGADRPDMPRFEYDRLERM